jgi:hypothetical protein
VVMIMSAPLEGIWVVVGRQEQQNSPVIAATLLFGSVNGEGGGGGCLFLLSMASCMICSGLNHSAVIPMILKKPASGILYYG